MELSRSQTIFSWAMQLVVAAILFQTLFFKFTGAEESKYIFNKLGISSRVELILYALNHNGVHAISTTDSIFKAPPAKSQVAA